MKQLISNILILFSLNTFSQAPCETSVFNLKQNDGYISITMARDGNLYVSRNTEEQAVYNKMLSFVNKYDKGFAQVSTNLMKTKSKLNLCYEIFIEQITPFLNKEINEVTLISTKGIPFLTFTRIE